MRQKYTKINNILNFIGNLMFQSSIVYLIPLIIVVLYWGERAEGYKTVSAFLVPAGLSFVLGYILKKKTSSDKIGPTDSMLICGLAWIVVSAFGALPFVIGIDSSYLNGYFEAMSGFTTTGITVYSGLDSLPYSIIFWRALTQWLGGLGILSLFLVLIFSYGGFHHIYIAESHKIASSRPRPGLLNTLKILWGIYILFTISSILILSLEGMSVFDSVCHTFTALSTGGFSPHDISIEFYRSQGFKNYKLIEYTLTFIMMLGGMNFMIHYRVLKKDFKALWDNTEMRLWWKLILIFTVLIMINNLNHAGFFTSNTLKNITNYFGQLEECFRLSLFQVISILTTTGYATKDINSTFFPALAKQLFLVMMVIGGCVGSTGGGIKVFRIAALKKMMSREIFKIRTSKKASNSLIIDKEIVPTEEIHRISSLFFAWIFLLLIGGTISAAFSDLNGWQAFSGMFSALGNIGPCYISVQEMIQISPVVKITYIFGMLAGRLEIMPVLLLFSLKAWK